MGGGKRRRCKKLINTYPGLCVGLAKIRYSRRFLGLGRNQATYHSPTMFFESCTVPTDHSYACEETVSRRSKQDKAMNTPITARFGMFVMNDVNPLPGRRMEK